MLTIRATPTIPGWKLWLSIITPMVIKSMAGNLKPEVMLSM
jgi:hypothetical protein